MRLKVQFGEVEIEKLTKVVIGCLSAEHGRNF